MRSTLSSICIALLLSACGHTKTATDQGQASEQHREPTASHHHGKPRPSVDQAHGEAHGEAKSESEPHAAPSPRDTNPPPLATSPAGLLKPGAAERIQSALTERGYLAAQERSGKLDSPTERALRAFQHDNHLPETGTPDDSTVGKLGLSPPDLFKANPSQ